jgi:hypothetical protein
MGAKQKSLLHKSTFLQQTEVGNVGSWFATASAARR